MRGGKRSGAGRKPGARTIFTIAIKQSLAATAKEIAPEALGAVVQMLRDRCLTPSARLDAAKTILHYAYGKPIAAVEVTGKDGGPVELRQMGVTELARRISAIIEAAANQPAEAAADSGAEQGPSCPL